MNGQLIMLPKGLMEKLAPKLERENVDSSTFIHKLMSSYVLGEIDRKEIKGSKRPEEIPLVVWLPLNADRLWGHCQAMCTSESKDPRRVIVDLIELSTK